MEAIESTLFTDPQRQAHSYCPHCGGCVYPPSYRCIRCRRDSA